MNPLSQRPYFFDKGIRFSCLRCGVCCTGAPGIVRVGEEEPRAMAAYLNQPVAGLIATYLAAFEDGYRVLEDSDGRCLFFENGCRVYPVRPVQCRTFPFWFKNLRSEAAWAATKKACPGIGQGRHYPREEILAVLETNMRQTHFLKKE